ncbi:MAG: AAA family ATPase, partial [Verrucomicrobiae bacterium]|nr:AAA family ATPase [Verrucomicrobiae bacterium]
GEVSVFSGETKSCKSWFALDLGLSVACGSPWMERQCHRGRVILVNLELPEWAIKKRLLEIAAKRGLNPTPDSILVWNLKGRTVYAHRIREHIQNANLSDVALVIVDPVYRLLGDADENSARDINALLGQIAGVAVDTGAHVILPAHFAKGSPAAKDPQDRASGSGVFARFPDSLLVMTKHENHEEGNGVYTVQSVLRTFPPAPSFVVRWRHPVFEVDSALDPSRLKQRKPGMQEQYSRELLLALLDGGPLTNKEWGMAADEAMRMPRKTFFDYVRRLEQSGAVGRTGDGKYCLPTR